MTEYSSRSPLVSGWRAYTNMRSTNVCIVLNGRQTAALLWVAIVMAAVLVWPTGRRSLAAVARAFFSRKIWPIFLLLGLWSVGLVLLGRSIGIWTEELAADTCFWFFTAAVVLLFNFNEASKAPGFFMSKAKETFGITLILGFLSDLFVLPVPVEFVGQGVLACLAALSAVAALEEGSEPVRKVADGCLALVGLTVMVLGIVALVAKASFGDVPDLARQFLLPAWMTLGVLPYIYAVALFGAYEMAFMRIDFRQAYGFRVRLRSRVVVIWKLRCQATLVNKFDANWGCRVAEAGSFGAASAVMDEFKQDLRQRSQDERDAAERLLRYAGIEGVDADGRQLDRREFEVTTRSLQWISTCQMGWGSRETGYRADILDVIGDLDSRGLAGDGGIELRVSAHGGSWYAWRRTVSGWVLAIGAAGPPLNEWRYDGPEPPSGFPGESPDWGSSPFEDDASPNW